MILALLLLATVAEWDDREGDLSAAQCWSAAGEVADANLNKVWLRISQKARAADKRFSPSPRKQHPSAMADLLASQRAWLKLRTAQCSLEGDYAQGGSLESVKFARCYTEMTRQRVKQLTDLSEGFDEA